MSFLNLKDKKILVFGVANRKSVAFEIGRLLIEEGASPVYVVHTEKRREQVAQWLEGHPIYVCDVEDEDEADRLAEMVKENEGELDGMVHSIAFANYSEGVKAFHETQRKDFFQAMQISAFSLVELARVFKPILNPAASVVTIGISSTSLTVENYGFMSPVKSTLEAIVAHLAKSFSKDTEVRFNAVGAGPLKTSSSAGIPGYMDNYIYAEMMTMRKKALKTKEVANTVLFLLSEKSSGINGEVLRIDAGLSRNAFDAEIVQKATRPVHSPHGSES